MSLKRQGPEDATFINEKRLRKSHSFRSVALEVINLIRMQNLMCPVLEPLIRRVVKEEVDSALRKYIVSVKRSCGKEARACDSRSLQLQFSNGISLPVFTGTRIEGEGGSSLELALVDVLTGQVVSSGPGSTAKVEMVVLEGDFDGDDWLPEELRNNVVREREGKKALLSGDVMVSLDDGKGSVGDVWFTDNSSWTRSRKFRLGARLVDHDIGGFRIREARSVPFVVRDHRGELYMKHHPPAMSDEVWRLEKIGKDGAFHKRLSKEGIRTVQDLLLLLSLDPSRLRNILGSGMSAKKWEVTVEHARTCVPDKRLYLYNTITTTSPGHNGIVFNAIGQLVGTFSDGQYVAFDKLSDQEKVDARQLINSAFRYGEKIVVVDQSSLNITTSPCMGGGEPPSDMESSDHNIGRSIFSQEVASSPDFMQSLYPFGAFDCYTPGVDSMEVGYDQPLCFPGQAADASISNFSTVAGAFSSDDHLGYFEPDCHVEPAPVLNGGNAANKGWGILACVLRWRFSAKRLVSRRSRC